MLHGIFMLLVSYALAKQKTPATAKMKRGLPEGGRAFDVTGGL